MRGWWKYGEGIGGKSVYVFGDLVTTRLTTTSAIIINHRNRLPATTAA